MLTVTEVHLFNPGGLPDLERSLQVSLSCDRAQVQVHRIAGDVISVGFLPEHQQQLSQANHSNDETVHGGLACHPGGMDEHS